MRRRKQPETSSLDLFLDTICNTFGGIVFLAILIAVLVQMRSKAPTSQQSDTVPVTAEEYHQIAMQVEELSSERRRLAVAIAQLQLMQGNSDDAAVAEQRKILEAKRLELEAQLAKQTDVTESVAKQMQENQEIQEEIDALQQQLIESQAALEQEQSALDEALADNMEVLKLPKVQRSFKSNIIMILQYGRLYAIYEPRSKSTFEKHVVATPVGMDLLVEPIRQAGWDLSDSLQRKDASDYLASHSVGSYFVSVAAFADSFADFAELKSLVLELGHDYQLQPFPNDAQIVITKSNELPTVQ
jgi:hypothetical protein